MYHFFDTSLVFCPNRISSSGPVTFLLAQKSNQKRALAPKLLPAGPSPTSLAQEPYAPALPCVIGVSFALFVKDRLVLRTLP
jgi:hypothetical protein